LFLYSRPDYVQNTTYLNKVDQNDGNIRYRSSYTSVRFLNPIQYLSSTLFIHNELQKQIYETYHTYIVWPKKWTTTGTKFSKNRTKSY